MGRGHFMVMLFAMVLLPVLTANAQCGGDCDGTGSVTVDDLITMVNIDLGSLPLSACQAGDFDNSGDIAINEVIVAVNNALHDCMDPLVHIDAGAATGAPGQSVAIPVTIRSSGVSIVATGNDISYRNDLFDLNPDDCVVNPDIGKTLVVSVLPPTSDPAVTTVRIFVQSLENTTDIPDGPLYTCTFSVKPETFPACYVLTNASAIAFRPDGSEYSLVTGTEGTIAVSLVGSGAGCLPTPTPTPKGVPQPCAADTKTCYVRASGRDTNTGADPANALQTISKAASLALTGYTIIVGPGTYRESVTTTFEAPQGLQFIADVAGDQTGDAAGPVMVVSPGAPVTVGFNLFSSVGTVIDGFTISGFSEAGIVIKSGSDNFTIQNTIMFGNNDGLRVQDSANVLIFNNLVYNNQGNGVVIAGQGSGSTNAHLINNTVADNSGRGLQVGNSTIASPQTYLRNNIFQANHGSVSIKVYSPPPSSVPRSDVGYDGDFNLVEPATYQPSSIKGVRDIPDAALFTDGACPATVLAAACAYHQQSSSPAIDAGDSLNTMLNLQNELRNLTTNGTDCDQGTLDLGFHYPTPTGSCP